MDEKQSLEQMFRRWMGQTPNPRGGRAALLRKAALLNQPKSVELAWFDVPGAHRPMDREISMFTWAMVGSFQTRISGIYLAI